MNIVNSVKEGFGNVNQKWENMSSYEKASMLIGVVAGSGLLLLWFFKQSNLCQLGNLLPMAINKIGSDTFVALIGVLLIVSGGLNISKLI